MSIPEEMMARLVSMNRPDTMEPKAEPVLSPREFLKRQALHYAEYEQNIRERYQKIQAVRAGWLIARYNPYESDWEHVLVEDLYDDDDENTTESEN